MPLLGNNFLANMPGTRHRITTNSNRLMILKANQQCIICGLVGAFWKLEMHSSAPRPHLGLYAFELNKRGEHILMTVDHIMPKSLGGSKELNNLQTMCTICNNLKANRANTIEVIESIRLKRQN